MRQHPKPGPALVSYLWCAPMAGTSISPAINGPVSDKGMPRVRIYIAGAVQTLISVIFAVNWHQESRNAVEREEDACAFLREKHGIREEYGLENGDGPVETASSAVGNPKQLEGTDRSHESRQGTVAARPDHMEGDDEATYTSDEQERRAAKGFHFDNPPLRYCGGFTDINSEVLRENWRIFFRSCVMPAAVLAETVGTIFADTLGELLILVIVSTVCCATSLWALRHTIVKVNMLGSSFDIVIVRRWSFAIGIPNHAMYLSGNAVVYDVGYVMAWMPTIVLVSRLCPRGSESMVFAVMSCFRSIVQTAAAQIGSVILEFGWTTDACAFSNLPMILLVCRILAPLLVIVLVVLVPDARICDVVDIDGRIVKERIEGRGLLLRDADSTHCGCVDKNPVKAVV